MNTVFVVWLGVFALGVGLGLCVRAKWVGAFVLLAFGICLAGLVAAGAFKAETATWVFGMALMALPILGVLLFAGAAVGNAFDKPRNAQER